MNRSDRTHRDHSAPGSLFHLPRFRPRRTESIAGIVARMCAAGAIGTSFWGLAPAEAHAQEVVVFDQVLIFGSDVDETKGLRRGEDQPILVIPVVTADSPFDPENNLLNDFDPAAPNLRQDLIDKFSQMNEFWMKNSYDLVSFDREVLDRFYQVPESIEDYFNLPYVPPVLIGSDIVGPPVDVPAGKVRMFLHVSDFDEFTIDLDFDAADPPFSLADLEAKIAADLAVAGDRLLFDVEACGVDCGRIEIEVDMIYVRAGSFIHIDFGASDDDVLDALGLDRTSVNLGGARVTGTGAEFPYTTQAADVLQIQVDNAAGISETFDWVMGNDVLAGPADFIAIHGATHPEVVITDALGELEFDVAPTIAGPYANVSFLGPAQLLDQLGLATSIEMDGVVTYAKRSTIKRDRRIIAGQAIAAFFINELTRSPAAPGPDPFPNLQITDLDEPELRDILNDYIDPRRIIAVIFLDAPDGQRAGASGWHIPIGIRNGDFTFQYTTQADIQIQYDDSEVFVIAHETGHNIGLEDLYDNSSGEYAPDLEYPWSWDVMHWDSDLAHTGVWHKHETNRWLENSGANVAVLDEPETAGTVFDGQYVLTPVEMAAAVYDEVLLGVPADRVLAKAIRLPVGRGIAAEDHFILVQNRQPGAVYSQLLPQNPAAPDRGGVYLTDAISLRSFDFFKPDARNFVHPLTNWPLVLEEPVPDEFQAIGTRPIIDRDPLEDINFVQTYPAYDGLEVDIVGELPGPAPYADRPAYLVDVRREQKDFLELGITPWEAPPWESEDIWIEWGFLEPDQLSSVPLEGNGLPARWMPNYNPAANDGKPLNWIRAKVTNNGTVDAMDVTIQVKVNRPGGMGAAGEWDRLGESDPVDIPAGESRILQVPWNPEVPGHTCVRVEVFRWTADFGDRDSWNNLTQENVNDFFPISFSPWGTTSFSFEITNDRSFEMEVALEPEGLDPGYTLTLEESFVIVPPNTSVLVNGVLELDDEIIPPPTSPPGVGFELRGEQIRRPPVKRDEFHLSAFVVGDEFRLPAGGITYGVTPSVRIDVNTEVVIGPNGEIIVTGTTSPAAPGTLMEVIVHYPSGRYDWILVRTDGSGSFEAEITPAEEGTVDISVRVPTGQGVVPLNTPVQVIQTGGFFPGAGRAGRHSVGMFLGGVVTDDSLPLDAGLEWGIRYRRRMHPRWSIEAELGMADTDAAAGDGLLLRAQVHAAVHLGGTWAQPFLLGGIGVADFEGRGRSDTSLLLTIGAGWDFRWSPRFGLRIDARYLWIDDLLSSGATNNWQLLWGPMLSF